MFVLYSLHHEITSLQHRETCKSIPKTCTYSSWLVAKYVFDITFCSNHPHFHWMMDDDHSERTSIPAPFFSARLYNACACLSLKTSSMMRASPKLATKGANFHSSMLQRSDLLALRICLRSASQAVTNGESKSFLHAYVTFLS